MTSGAQSHPQNFNHANLALAARHRARGAAADGVEALGRAGRTAHGRQRRRPSWDERTITYGELIGGRKFNLSLNTSAKRKVPREWTILGNPVKRLDMPDMVTGRFEYVHNVRVPGMVHGRVVRPPTVGATVVSVDESSVSGMPGFVKVVVKKNFVGVVCEKQWQAVQAAQPVEGELEARPRASAAGELLRSHAQAAEPRHAARRLERCRCARSRRPRRSCASTYLHPYHMHGSIGASCAVADVKADSATIWSPTQGVYPQRDSCAMVLGMKPQQVKVIYSRGSGLLRHQRRRYGVLRRRADVAGRGPPRARAALAQGRDGARKLRPRVCRRSARRPRSRRQHRRVGLRSVVADARRPARPHAAGQSGDGISRRLPAGARSRRDRRRRRQRVRSRTDQNVVPSYVTGTVNGEAGGTGTVKCERMLSRIVESPFWTGPLRSPNRLQNTFAHECMMDELAAAAKADPVEYPPAPSARSDA